jgi:hypothetical protein
VAGPWFASDCAVASLSLAVLLDPGKNGCAVVVAGRDLPAGSLAPA